jgi:hypothetical protein
LCEPKPTKAERLALEWLRAAESGDSDKEAELQALIDEIDNRPPRLREAALTYASWGWPVFPLKPHTKVPATRNGFKDATTDTGRIQTWWDAHPDANIGIPTGVAFDVIDIDVPDGPASLTKLLGLEDPRTGLGPLPEAHGIVATASGGTHYYIAPQGGANKARIMPGIDTRGAGGYVVAPPSTLGTSGRSWSWAVAPSPAIKNMGAVA